MKGKTTILPILLLLAILGWQQYQIHEIKLEVAKLDRTAADTIDLLTMQNILDQVLGFTVHGINHLNDTMSDKLSKFDHYPSKEEREKSR